MFGKGKNQGREKNEPRSDKTSEEIREEKRAGQISRRNVLLGAAGGATALAIHQGKRIRKLGQAAVNVGYNVYMDDVELNVPANLQGKSLQTNNPEFHVAGDSMGGGQGNIVNGEQVPFSDDIQRHARQQGFPKANAINHARSGSDMSDISDQLKAVSPPKEGRERAYVGWTGHNYKPAQDVARSISRDPAGSLPDYLLGGGRKRLADKFERDYERVTREALDRLGTRAGILLLLEPFERAPRLVLIKPDGSQEVLADLRTDTGKTRAQRVGLKDMRMQAGQAIINVAQRLNREGYNLSVQNPGETIKKRNFGKTKANDQHPNAEGYDETAKGVVGTRKHGPF